MQSRLFVRDKILQAMSDGEWHSLDEILDAVMHHIPPGVATRTYRWKYKKTDSLLAVQIFVGRRLAVYKRLERLKRGGRIIKRGKHEEREYRLSD